VQKVRAFLLGVREFRRDLTTHFGEDLIEVYDRGREFAHKVTLRYWDEDYHRFAHQITVRENQPAPEDDRTDWCDRCNRVTTYAGERCTVCGREWGNDESPDLTEFIAAVRGWVIVEGGLVVDTSEGIDVFDLDVLHDDFPDHLAKSEVEDTLDRLHQSPAFVTSPALQQAARQCEKWLERY